MRIAKFRIRDRNGSGGPVGRDPTPQPIRIIPRPKIIEACFGIALFAVELVMVGIVVDELKLSAPRVVIGFCL